MKKFFTILMCAIIAIASFAACDGGKHEHTPSAWKYSETHHWRIPECDREDCAVEDVVWDLGEHENKDADLFCDVCGYAMPVHVHTYNYVSEGEVGHYKNFTCGCPSEEGTTPHNDVDSDFFCDECGDYMDHLNVDVDWKYSETHHWRLPDSSGGDMIGVVYGYGEHENMDADMFCDVCGYHMVDIPAPTNYFLRNQAGCEWLNEITAEDIAKIKIIGEAVGVAPGSPKVISTSTDTAVIARIFEAYYWLDTWPISKEEGQIDGGGAVTVKFILKDGTEKQLYINNGNYCDRNGDYFEVHNTPQFNGDDDVTKAYGFITYIGNGTVYDSDDNLVGEIPMDELEFIITGYDLSLFAGGYEYYVVEAEFGKLHFAVVEIFASEGGVPDELIRTDCYFFMENDTEFCYRLVGKDLLQLIDEYCTMID